MILCAAHFAAACLPHKTRCTVSSTFPKYEHTQIVIAPLCIIYLIHISSQRFMTALMNTPGSQRDSYSVFLPPLSPLFSTALFSFIRQMIPKAILTGPRALQISERETRRRAATRSTAAPLFGQSPRRSPLPPFSMGVRLHF
jgi:hypothetical protein